MGIYKRPDSKKWWISYYLNGEQDMVPGNLFDIRTLARTAHVFRFPLCYAQNT